MQIWITSSRIFCMRMHFIKAWEIPAGQGGIPIGLEGEFSGRVQPQFHRHIINPIERWEQVPARSWRCPDVNYKPFWVMGTIYTTAGLIPHSAHSGAFIFAAVSGNIEVTFYTVNHCKLLRQRLCVSAVFYKYMGCTSSSRAVSGVPLMQPSFCNKRMKISLIVFKALLL